MNKKQNPIIAIVLDILLVYIINAVCRIAYVLENWKYFANDISELSAAKLFHGAFVFDSATITYFNILFVVLALLPFVRKENSLYDKILKWIYVLLNSLVSLANLADSVYFPYTGKRTTTSVFSEFANESNTTDILISESINHWYLVILLGVIIFALCRLYIPPTYEKSEPPVKNITIQIATLLAAIVLGVFGMRGTFDLDARPKGIRDANIFVNRPAQTAIVLNTPYSLIRTIGHSGFRDPQFYDSGIVEKIFSPVHTPCDSMAFDHRNIVVFITEGLGREYIGFYNKNLEDGNYKGYTPFLDSLISESLTFEYSFANGRKSIDGMPSILSSLPMMENDFFTSPYINNEVSGLSACLADKGYRTTFFHGADNGSMGFDSYSRAIKYQDYYGRNEYNADKDFGGDNDYDGRWAIWDHNFMEFWEKHLDNMPEPFLSTIFTATSHSPYKIPEAYRDTFTEGPLPMHKCIKYVDHCFRMFFDHVKQMPWYNNTIFVITGDHTSLTDHAEYQTALGLFCSPVVIFDPSGRTPKGMSKSIAQQADVMPTILSLLHYDKPYVAYGVDLLSTPADSTWAVNFSNGIYQYVKGDYVLQFDGREPKAIYDFRRDWMMTNNLVDNPEMDSTKESMTRTIKAMMQSYIERMIENRLTDTSK